jgi:hypothetical protein
MLKLVSLLACFVIVSSKVLYNGLLVRDKRHTIKDKSEVASEYIGILKDTERELNKNIPNVSKEITGKEILRNVALASCLDGVCCKVTHVFLPQYFNSTCYQRNLEVELFCETIYTVGYITQQLPDPSISFNMMSTKQIITSECETIKK